MESEYRRPRVSTNMTLCDSPGDVDEECPTVLGDYSGALDNSHDMESSLVNDTVGGIEECSMAEGKPEIFSRTVVGELAMTLCDAESSISNNSASCFPDVGDRLKQKSTRRLSFGINSVFPPSPNSPEQGGRREPSFTIPLLPPVSTLSTKIRSILKKPRPSDATYRGDTSTSVFSEDLLLSRRSRVDGNISRGRLNPVPFSRSMYADASMCLCGDDEGASLEEDVLSLIDMSLCNQLDPVNETIIGSRPSARNGNKSLPHNRTALADLTMSLCGGDPSISQWTDQEETLPPCGESRLSSFLVSASESILLPPSPSIEDSFCTAAAASDAEPEPKEQRKSVRFSLRVEADDDGRDVDLESSCFHENIAPEVQHEGLSLALQEECPENEDLQKFFMSAPFDSTFDGGDLKGEINTCRKSLAARLSLMQGRMDVLFRGEEFDMVPVANEILTGYQRCKQIADQILQTEHQIHQLRVSSEQEVERMESRIDRKKAELKLLSDILGFQCRPDPEDPWIQELVFFKLDKADPSREFKIRLTVNKEKKFSLLSSSPRLDNLHPCVDHLNHTMDLRAFLCDVRRRFQDLIQKS